VTRLPQAQFDEALQWLLASSTWWGGQLRVRLGSWPEDRFVCQRWRDGAFRGDLARAVRFYDEEFDDEILIGLPWDRKDSGGVSRTSVLWARVEGAEQLGWAKRFRPLPSMILQEGSSSRRWLLWFLEQPVDYVTALKLNRRLAYKFSAVQKWADPDVLWLPAPGTCLRADRARPVPVRVSRMTLDTYWPNDVAGALRDPPEPVWMDAARR
jgi:hypothetical protein